MKKFVGLLVITEIPLSEYDATTVVGSKDNFSDSGFRSLTSPEFGAYKFSTSTSISIADKSIFIFSS